MGKLQADPLADISNTQRIRAVVANGRLFRRADLDWLLAEHSTARVLPVTSALRVGP